jgi:hypothetical protein
VKVPSKRSSAILVGSHLGAVVLGGLLAAQAPQPSAVKVHAKSSVRSWVGKASADESRAGSPQTQWRREIVEHNRELDRLAESISDFEAELDVANARLVVGRGGDAERSVVFWGFKRWLMHDRAAALRWLGGAGPRWDVGLYGLIFSDRTLDEIGSDLSAIQSWPGERRLSALVSLGGAKLDRAGAVYAALGTAEERASFIKGRLASPRAEIAEVIDWLHGMNASERAPLVEAIHERLSNPSGGGFPLSEENVRSLEAEPEFALAAAEAAWLLKRTAIEALARTNPAEALVEMRAGMEARGESPEAITGTLNQMKADRMWHQIHSEFQAAKIGLASAEGVMREFIRRYEADIGPCPRESLQRLLSLGMMVDSGAVVRVAFDHLSGEDFDPMRFGNSTGGWQRAIGAFIDAGHWDQLVKRSEWPHSWDSVLGLPASSYFRQNETAALEWAWGLGHPEARQRAIMAIHDALVEGGREAEAADLQQQLESIR